MHGIPRTDVNTHLNSLSLSLYGAGLILDQHYNAVDNGIEDSFHIISLRGLETAGYFQDSNR
jgi:hypothetical protein